MAVASLSSLPNGGPEIVMKLAKRMLLLLSRPPESGDYEGGTNEYTIDTALSLLSGKFPDFPAIIVGKTIVDFGCGTGFQSLALARAGAKSVFGIDTNISAVAQATKLAETFGLGEKVKFADKIDSSIRQKFDVVISQNSMEHFPDPVAVLKEMKYLVKEDGRLLISFGPPWYAPYGSHMHFFTKMPWINILFSEATVMEVRHYFRNDRAARYEDVPGGLNKMTVEKFENIIADCGMEVILKKYDCVKGLNLLGRIRWLRELFINHVSCILVRQQDSL